MVDTVELHAATDPELPQPLQGWLVQAGGPYALSIERQLQPSLLAQEQHLEESLGVEEEGGRDQRLPSPGRDPGQSPVCEGSPECHRNMGGLVPQTQCEILWLWQDQPPHYDDLSGPETPRKGT